MEGKEGRDKGTESREGKGNSYGLPSSEGKARERDKGHDRERKAGKGRHASGKAREAARQGKGSGERVCVRQGRKAGQEGREGRQGRDGRQKGREGMADRRGQITVAPAWGAEMPSSPALRVLTLRSPGG